MIPRWLWWLAQGHPGKATYKSNNVNINSKELFCVYYVPTIVLEIYKY